jgi:chromosome segregation protein
MQGFKSFAEKTVIEFGDGITAVVGPNGSGKSNISDAVRWVLGEQRARSLRALSMEDVIFSGTETRKPVNFAEVSVVIDNTDGSLNVDYEDVKITRRLFRSGKSEYLINDRIARLSDINMLLADTGIGKEGYSIIGQGKVDAILSTKSEIRRGIFEEASGIAKYRMRKKESESKLEQAEQNLIVIDGVINELAAQIAILKRQAVSAEQYLKLKYELRDIEVGVLVRGIEEAEAKLAEIKGKFDSVNGEISDGEKTVAEIRTENDERNRLEEKLDAEYNDAKEKAFEADRSANEAQAAVTLNLQRIENVKNEIARMEGENREKKRQADENKKKIGEIEEEKKQILKDLSDLEAEIGKEQRRLDIVINALSGGSEQATKMNREIVEKRLAAERHRAEVNSLGRQSEIYGERIAQLEQEIEAGRSEMEQARANLDEMLAKYDSEAGTLSDLEKEFAAHTKTRDDTADEIDEKSAELAKIKSEIDTGEAQLRLLREMEQNLEGYARSVKEILSLCRQNRQFGRGIYGAVAQIITVGEEDEAAVEVALGNNFQDIITEDEESAKQAIEYLKENRFGRATFLPLTAVNARYMEAEAMEKLKKVRGFVGIASNLVKYDPKYENAVASLLGRVAVFEDIDSAIYAARQNKYSFMCVTREGDILRTSGAITGGSP